MLKGDYRDVHSEDPETVKDKCGVSIHSRSSSSSSSGTLLCQAAEFGVKHSFGPWYKTRTELVPPGK